MARWIFTLISFALLGIGRLATPWVLSSKERQEGLMGLLDYLDSLLLGSDPFSPTLVVIGLAGLISIWIVMPVARIWREKWLRAQRRQFYDQFNSIEQTANRQKFRWNLERAYRKHKEKSKPGDLAELIREIQFPDSFPPTDDIVSYAENVAWPNEQGERFWVFCKELFRNVLEIDKRKEKLSEPSYSDLLNGRLVVSKFWDDWAGSICDGLLSVDDVRQPLEANQCDIRALAICELALARSIGWDRSSGKQNLFKLAKSHLNLTGGERMARIRRWIAARFRSLATWVHPNGAR